MRIFNIGLCLAGALASEICYYYQECDMGCYSDQPPWGGTDARPNNHLPQAQDEKCFVTAFRKLIKIYYEYF